MPHPDAEHSLRIQLATALRERDEARTQTERWLRVVEKLRENLNVTLLERDALKEALAAARLAYQPICERVCGDDGEHVTACIRVRKALAAPAAASGEEGK